jgi:hypothetical protein
MLARSRDGRMNGVGLGRSWPDVVLFGGVTMDDGTAELIDAIRALQGDVLESHERAVDTLAAVRAADLMKLSPSEIADLARLAVATAQTNIVALMAAAHALDLMADYFAAMGD